jgi:hypothetical protein
MSPEELDRATADEAWRLWQIQGADHPQPAVIAARLAREGWKPPKPVDPDVLAYREWKKKKWPSAAEFIDGGVWDENPDALGFLAGARMAREQEQERARVLVEPAEAIVNRAVRGTGSNDLRWPHILKAARRLEKGLTAYKAGKEAGK